MTRHVGRAVAGLASALLGALVTSGVAVVPGPAPISAPAAVDDQDPLPVEVRITEVTPRVLGPGDDLQLRVEVRNTGPTTVAQPRVLAHLDRSSFISRSSLDRWRNAGTDAPVGSAVLAQDLPAELGPNQTSTVTLLVPASAVLLPVRRTTWGARGLAVQVVDAADPARTRLGLARTFALWFPDQEVTPTRVSVVAPVVGVGVDPHTDAWVDELERLTRPGGRLANLLVATGDHPEVTWVVDPWLADAAPDAGPVTQIWVTRLLTRVSGREVILLPYLDPDLAALAHAGAGELLATAVDRAEHAAATTDLPDDAHVTLAWPADDLPDLATATLADQDRHDALLVAPGELLTPVVLTYTPSGRTTVTAGGVDIPVLVPDERLSAALLTGVVGPIDGEVPSSVVTPATAAQDLLAELAVITRERPSDGRHMLLSVPRDWTADPDVVSAQLAAMTAAPWVQMEPVSALVDLDDPHIDRGTLADRVVTGTEVEAAALGTVRNAVDRRRLLASVTADPAALLGDLELEQLAPTSVAWRDDPVGRAESVAASHMATQAIDGRVTVQPTGDVTLVSSSGGLPVQVTNTFDQEVTLVVALRVSDNRLVVDGTVPVTIPAEEQALVQVPVHAVQSADVAVTVELRAPDGTVLDDGTRFMVRVRAEWEGIGTAVIAGLLAIGLVIGIARTIRRGRTARRAAPQTASGPDALSPEETAEQAEDAADGAASDRTTAEHAAEPGHDATGPADEGAAPGTGQDPGTGGPPGAGPEEAGRR